MDAILNFLYQIGENIEYFGTLALFFVATLFLVLAVYLLIIRKSAASERLQNLLPGKTLITKKTPKLVESEEQGFSARVIKPLHDLIAPNEDSMRKKLRIKLIQGGFRSERSVHKFLALKIVLALVVPGFYLGSRIFYGLTMDMALMTLLLMFLSFFIPNVFLWLITKSRQEDILHALPDALDLMVVCVQAGLGLDMTLKRVGEEMRAMSRNLSDEFLLTNLEVRSGRSREESLKNMGLRTGVSEVNNLMTILVQTSRFGTSLANSLKVHADAMRVRRRQIAEETAAKSTVKLVFPLVLFIFPSIFIVIIGPGAIKIVQVLFPALSGGG